MNENELYKTFCESAKRRNPHLAPVGEVLPAERKQVGLRPLVNRKPVQKSGSTRVVVSLVRYGRGTLDDDNLQGSFKHLRDCIAASLEIDDADARIRWEYGQIETKGRTGCTVKIELR